MPTIDFAYANSEQLDALFAFEELADAELHGTGLGAIDGNEIGEGVFTLFLEPKRGKRAQALSAVELLALDRGLRPQVKPKGRS
jgi:hypothetical protein